MALTPRMAPFDTWTGGGENDRTIVEQQPVSLPGPLLKRANQTITIGRDGERRSERIFATGPVNLSVRL